MTWQSHPPAPSLRGAFYATWQSHPPAPSLRGAFYATWQSHFLFFSSQNFKRRDPHGFKKRSLRMTPVASDEILTREGTAQDDELKAHPPNPPQWGNLLDGIFQIEFDLSLNKWNS
jgi:hypothetical protein